jgi:CRISPR-associated protein Cmr2
MDGDSTGDLLDKCNDEERQQISRCIGAFSRAVPNLVAAQDGWLIYAGGEDVFALLPLENAISCAVQLQRCFKNQFKQQLELSDIQRRERLLNSITISGAINFVSIHTALSVAVRDTRELLEDYAKDRMGRDTLACRVWKRGGPVLTWSLPWQKVLWPKKDVPDWTLLDEVIDRFQSNGDDVSQFSSRFFYRLGDLFTLLEPPGGAATFKNEAEAVALLTAEYLANRDLKWDHNMSEADKRQEARERIKLLLHLCRVTYRRASRSACAEIGEERFEFGHIQADGALLVRFLAQQGLGE